MIPKRRGYIFLSLLVFDFGAVLVLGYLITRDKPDIWAYLQAITAIIAILLAVKPISIVLGPVSLIETIQLLGTSRRLQGSILFSTLLLLTALFWSTNTLSLPLQSATGTNLTPTTTTIRSSKLFGPSKGEILHGADGGAPDRCAQINVKNFSAEANFYNPYDGAQRKWSYGFYFRKTGPNNQYRLSINSDGRLGFGLYQEGGLSDKGEQLPKAINTHVNGYNHVKINVIDDEAAVFINNVYIITFKPSSKTEAGDVCVATGILGNDKIPGEVTEYDNFVVSAIP